MKWQDIPISMTTCKRNAINAVINEWGDITLGELANKTHFELMRVNRMGVVARASLQQTIEDAKGGRDVRHDLHKRIGEAA